MDSRKERIRLLVRINRRRAAAPAFLAELSSNLGELIDATKLLSVPESDEIRETFRMGYLATVRHAEVSYRRCFRSDERTLIFRLIDCLASSLVDEDVFLVIKTNKDCVAVRLNVSVLLHHTASILCLDGDSLSALSEDRKQGILIDQNPDDTEQAYEVVLWGDRWPLLALACDQNRER